jgi:hypothetical protein
MNEQAASAAIAQAREAKANRLLSAILDDLSLGALTGWTDICRRIPNSGLTNVRTLLLEAYEAGYDDGFAKAEAYSDEPDRNEGYE